MATWLFWAIVWTIVNRLLPFPPLDDRIRAGYAWVYAKVKGWL